METDTLKTSKENQLEKGTMNVITNTKKIFIGVCLGIVLALGVGVAVFLSFKDESGSELKIDNTANIVTGIKKISEFNVITFYEELVLKEKKDTQVFFEQVSTTNEIVIIAKGSVRVGFDLSKVKESDIVVMGDTLTVIVPSVEIFDIIVNPSDFEIFFEDGSWSHEEVTKIESNAKSRLKEDAINNNILNKANEIGIEKLVSFFRSFGFKIVNITIRDSYDEENTDEISVQ
ncbi:MAG: DUF4230 domain-containing protein [Bacteroidales bacterium]|nr:DUF4230 domain-containing protein [Bacteroidales bacterium]